MGSPDRLEILAVLSRGCVVDADLDAEAFGGFGCLDCSDPSYLEDACTDAGAGVLVTGLIGWEVDAGRTCACKTGGFDGWSLPSWLDTTGAGVTGALVFSASVVLSVATVLAPFPCTGAVDP